jgi:Flp pilus assembly protein TadB
MSADRRRWTLVGVLVVAAIVSPVVPKAGLALFVVAAALFLRWRRAAIAERRAKVFDREAKTYETGTRTDQ